MRTVYFEKNIPKILLTKTLQPLWANVIYSRWSPTRLENLPDQALPGPNWVRVRNLLCGICTSDLHFLFVETDPQIAAAALPGTERIYLGHEVVGEVVEVGAGVTTLSAGDRVVMDSRAILSPNCISQELNTICRHCARGDRALCENASLGVGRFGTGGGWGDSFTAHVSEVYKVPKNFDDETAMMIEPLSVGVRAALRRLPQSGEQALVVGCGVVGLNLLQSLRALSPACRITAIARYPHQIEMAQKLGADRVITDDLYEATAEITDGKLYTGPLKNRMILGGFDTVFDCVGSAQTIQDSVRLTRAGGAVVLVGVSLVRMKVDLMPVWYQEVDLVGSMAHGMEEWNGASISTYDLVCALLAEGKLTIDGLITHAYPLDRWRDAVNTASDKRTGAIKVIFDYRDTGSIRSRP